MLASSLTPSRVAFFPSLDAAPSTVQLVVMINPAFVLRVSSTVYVFSESVTLMGVLSSYTPLAFFSKSTPSLYVPTTVDPSLTVNDSPSRSSWVTSPLIVLVMLM